MSDELRRWARAKAIFQAALERKPEDRRAYLDAACSAEPALRTEVESLLLANEQMGSFAERPAIATLAPVVTPTSKVIGRKLEHYEIQALLGAGGMGVVYKARDTRPKLDRAVALKVLPPELRDDPELLRRFEREGLALAALNHPHICTVFDVGRDDGIDFLVMEYVPGATLSERLSKSRGLPVPEALAIASDIADALDAAHAQGIIHRDLKPANVKITPDGVVKVLDFGLAKAASPDPSQDLTQSPTVTIGRTRDGVILGTPAYMSPEQARGLAVDKRTDIWAFGCILYEMLCGRAAFAAGTITDTLAAVVDREPDWTALPQATTSTVRTVLMRCLVKDPKRRIRDIGDVQLALSGAFDTSDKSSPARRSLATTSSLRLLVVAATTLIAVASTAVVLLWPWARPAPRLSRLSILSPDAAALLVNTGRAHRTLTITPDGSSIVYIGGNSTRLFARPLDALEPLEIAAGRELVEPFVSADGHWVGFAEGNALKKVALTGGTPIAFANLKGILVGAAWLPDNTIVFATNDPTTGLQRIPVAGGPPNELTRPDRDRGQTAHIWPESLPGGNAVLFTILSQTGGQDSAQVAVLDLQSHTQKILLSGASHAQYIDSGHLAYTAAGALWAVSFNLRKLETQGTPVRVVPRLVTTVNGSGQFAVAREGTLVYADGSGATSEERTLVWVDRTGKETPLGAPPRTYLAAKLAPEGTRVAVDIADQDQDLWVWDMRRSTLSRVTADPANDASPVWTPDGQRLIFASQRDGGIYNLWGQAADGTGTAERLTTNATTQTPTSISPDGRDVVFFENTLARGFDLSQIRLPGLRVSALLQTPFHELNGTISPDGRWLAYASSESGRYEIHVRPFPNTSAGQWIVSTIGGKMPAWSTDALFFFNADGALISVPFDPRRSTWQAGASTKVLEARYFTGGTSTIVQTYDVSRDGRRFLMIKPSQTDRPSSPASLVVVQHWDKELTARAPAK